MKDTPTPSPALPQGGGREGTPSATQGGGRALTITFIGDAATASAFALTGAATHPPPPGEELAAFERARESSDVVLLGNDFAASLPPNALENALVALAPLVAILHDASGRPAVPTPAERARRQLGFET